MVEKIWYETDVNDRLRFVLGKYSTNPLFVIGLNPSTATPEKSDITFSKVQQFARNDGFDGVVMLNLYPQRSTLPEGLHKRGQSRLIQENAAKIKIACSAFDPIYIWAAWGNQIESRPYLIRSLQLIADQLSSLPVKWLHRGPLTKAGHPRHPSRMGYQVDTFVFNLPDYLRKFS
ncbi:MAG: DUF1643 domain-containing protein [Bacteroidota bacterium]